MSMHTAQPLIWLTRSCTSSRVASGSEPATAVLADTMCLTNLGPIVLAA
jgi:hypothetical protein